MDKSYFRRPEPTKGFRANDENDQIHGDELG
jgi:hypothetical protein